MENESLPDNSEFYRELSKNKIEFRDIIKVDGEEFTPDEVISGLSDQVTPERLSRIKYVVGQRSKSIVPVLEHIYDRGNVSAVMRSAEAFGFIRMHIIKNPGEKFKAANRVSQGSDKWLDLSVFDKTEQSLTTLKAQGFQLLCTDLESSVSIEQIDFTRPTALLFGNEKEGASVVARELADQNILLPMHGFAQSFNISVAAALCFQQIFLARQKAGIMSDLSEGERKYLTARYLLKNMRSAAKILKRKSC